MTTFFRTTLATCLVSLVLVSALAVAHPPEEETEPVPDETLRAMFLVSEGASRTYYSNNTGSYQQQPQDMHLGLSFDPNATTSPSRQYAFRTPVRAYYCVQPTIGYCPSQPFHADADLGNKTQDIQLVPEDSYKGALALSWTYSGNYPSGSYSQPPTVWVEARLTVAGVPYGGNAYTLTGSRGDKILPLEFVKDGCHEHHDGGGAYCEAEPEGDGADNDTTANETELWSHDVVLTLNMRRVDYQTVSFGDTFSVKLETSGRSLLEVHEFVPPPVEALDLAADNETVDGEAIDVQWQDADGDGEHDLDEVALVPAPGVFGAAAALGALAYLRRRRAN